MRQALRLAGPRRARAAGACLVLALLALSGSAHGEEESAVPLAPEPPAAAPAPKWEFTFAPYLWAISVKGTLETHHFRSDVDVSFSDILSDLDIDVAPEVVRLEGSLDAYGPQVGRERELPLRG